MTCRMYQCIYIDQGNYSLKFRHRKWYMRHHSHRGCTRNSILSFPPRPGEKGGHAHMTTQLGGLASMCGPAAARQMSGGMGSSQEGCATKSVHLSESNNGGVDLRATSQARHGCTGGPRYHSPAWACCSDLRHAELGPSDISASPPNRRVGIVAQKARGCGEERRNEWKERQGAVGSSVERSGACRRQQAAAAAVRPGPCRTQSRGARMHGRCYLPVAHRGRVGGKRGAAAAPPRHKIRPCLRVTQISLRSPATITKA